jgi:hypothetical protein
MAPATAPRDKTLYIQVEVGDVLIQADDTNFKQVFVNKNEVVDTLHENHLYKTKGQNMFKILKSLKSSKLNEKVMIL